MSSQVVNSNTEAAILGRLLAVQAKMTREVAEFLLGIDFEAADTDRMNLLSERVRQGALTEEETAELDSYLHAGSLLSILQSRARRFLKNENSALTTP